MRRHCDTIVFFIWNSFLECVHSFCGKVIHHDLFCLLRLAVIMRDRQTITSTLTHWGRVTHICVSKLTIIGSDNGLSPGRRQAIIWTNAWILLIWTLGTNFSETLGKIHSFSFKKMHLKMSSAQGCLFSIGFNELRWWWQHQQEF